MSIAKKIRQRLLDKDIMNMANDNLAQYISDTEREALKVELEEKLEAVYQVLLLDTKNDHNLQDTAKRVSRMYIDEIFKGRFLPQPKITVFPNVKKLDEMYAVGPISIRSTCAHHFAPITGQAWIGVIPGDKLMGLSKFHRITDWVFSRPQIQEEAVVQLADEIESLIEPKGMGVVVKAQHGCMTWRGVKEHDTQMTTSVMRGLFRKDERTRNEFLSLI